MVDDVAPSAADHDASDGDWVADEPEDEFTIDCSGNFGRDGHHPRPHSRGLPRLACNGFECGMGSLWSAEAATMRGHTSTVLRDSSCSDFECKRYWFFVECRGCHHSGSHQHCAAR